MVLLLSLAEKRPLIPLNMLHVDILGLLPGVRAVRGGQIMTAGRGHQLCPLSGEGGGGRLRSGPGRPPGFVARLRTRRAARGVAALTDAVTTPSLRPHSAALFT